MGAVIFRQRMKLELYKPSPVGEGGRRSLTDEVSMVWKITTHPPRHLQVSSVIPLISQEKAMRYAFRLLPTGNIFCRSNLSLRMSPRPLQIRFFCCIMVRQKNKHGSFDENRKSGALQDGVFGDKEIAVRIRGNSHYRNSRSKCSRVKSECLSACES